MDQEKVDERMKSDHPKFTGPRDFLRALGRLWSIFVRGSLDGGPVHRPWIDNRGWLTPVFREKLCLVVAYNNHCVG
jgi:hypothetical protein